MRRGAVCSAMVILVATIAFARAGGAQVSSGEAWDVVATVASVSAAAGAQGAFGDAELVGDQLFISGVGFLVVGPLDGSAPWAAVVRSPGMFLRLVPDGERGLLVADREVAEVGPDLSVRTVLPFGDLRGRRVAMFHVGPSGVAFEAHSRRSPMVVGNRGPDGSWRVFDEQSAIQRAVDWRSSSEVACSRPRNFVVSADGHRLLRCNRDVYVDLQRVPSLPSNATVGLGLGVGEYGTVVGLERPAGAVAILSAGSREWLVLRIPERSRRERVVDIEVSGRTILVATQQRVLSLRSPGVDH